MTNPSPFTLTERLESLKAAVCGGMSAGSVSLSLLAAHRVLNQSAVPPLKELFFSLAGQTLLINWAIAALAGALFALTYRYAIRQDANPQLNLGVVFAFALVRGLAQVDAGSAIAQHFWPFFAACGESLLIFGSSAIGLNIALEQGWLKPFGKI